MRTKKQSKILGRLFLSKRSLSAWVTFVLVFAVTVCMSVSLKSFAYDDAYIHMRISRNFAENGVPYFNANASVMSTSSFVWTCLLMTLYRLNLDVLTVLPVLNSVFFVGGLFVWMTIASCQLKMPHWSVFLFGVFYAGWMIPSVVGLMETPLAFFLIGCAIYLIHRDYLIGWMLAAVAVFTRLELLVFIPLLLAYKWVGRKLGWNSVVVLGSMFVTLSFFLWHYYGTVLPNTIGAKSLVYPIPIHDVWKNVFKQILPSYNWVFLIGLAVLVSFMLVKYWPKLWGVRIGLVMLCAGSSVAATYIVKGGFLFPWYYPLFGVPLTLGILWLSVASGRLLFQILLVFLIGLHPVEVLGKYIFASMGNVSALPDADAGARVQRYLELGAVLQTLFPEATLLTSEIGGLGYSFGGEILDGVGLVSPSSLKFHPMSVPDQRSSVYVGAIPSALVYEKLPELIVSYPIFIEEFLRSDWASMYYRIQIPAFSKHNELVLGKSDIWGCDELFIFIRHDQLSRKMDVLEMLSL